MNHPQEPPRVNIENQRKGGRKEKISQKRENTQFKLPPPPDLKHKGRVYAGKEGAMKNLTPPIDLNRKATSRVAKEAMASGLVQASHSNYRKRLSSVNEAAVPTTDISINLNQSEKFQTGNGNGLGTRMPVFDLNQETSYNGKEAARPTRAPIFDLNEISVSNYWLHIKVIIGYI